MKRWVAILILVLFVAILAWIAWPDRRPQTVRPERRDIVEVIIASGNLQAETQSDIGVDVTGIVEEAFVREGDQVSAGQILFTLDRGAVEQRVEQARLALQTAQRELERMRRPAPAEDIARAQAELSQARRVGEERLEQARQRLLRLERGGRPEERAQAQSALNQARANRRQAELDLQRAEQLFDRGAIPRAELDRAQTQLELAIAAEITAEERLALAIQPAPSEEIAVARAEVRAAEAGLEESVRIAEQNLRALRNIPRDEDVQVARARAQEAQAALRQAEQEANRFIVFSPINGIVVNRNIEPGQSVTPGFVAMQIADMSRIDVVVDTDETNLPRFEVGQNVILISPAYPDQPFMGILREIGPEVDIARGVVQLRIRPLEFPDFIRPDMTIDANIEVAEFPDTLSLPITSLEEIEGRTYVYVLVNGEERRQEITVLARGENYFAADGISEDAEVIENIRDTDPNNDAFVPIGDL